MGRLLDTCNEYIDWQEFYLWVRSVLEVENHVPDRLVEILNERCPGFVENQKRVGPKAAKCRPVALGLEDWIDDQIFGLRSGKTGRAITFHATHNIYY